MISIVLPTYNGSKYIAESIESVIAQTYQDWELIVIDDCSTDDTDQIVQKYADRDSRINLYKNEKNLKLPASLNRGFSLSKGEYLTWTSDDNRFKQNALQALMDGFGDEDVGLVFSAMDYIDAEGRLVGHTPQTESTDELYYNNIVGASFMYTREVYEKIGNYDTEKFLVEDYDYWLRIARIFPIKFINDSLYLYRIHSGSLTEKKNKEMLRAKIQLLTNVINEEEGVSHSVKAKIYGEIAIAAFSLDQYPQMKECVRQIKNLTEDLDILPLKIKISCVIGKYLTSFVKKMCKVFRRVK